MDDIVNLPDKKQYCAELFVDLSQTFDTADHSCMLLFVHFDDSPYSLFKSYLSGRLLVTVVAGFKSNPQIVDLT